jgi:hypothetical protein
MSPRAPTEIELNRRLALLGAVEAFADRGYERTELEDLRQGSGTDHSSYPDCFADKESCFLAAYDLLLSEALRQISASARARGTWSEKLAAGLATILKIVDQRPGPARLVLLEAKAASAKTAIRYRATLRMGANFLRAGRAHRQRPMPAGIDFALAGGLAVMIAQQLRSRPGEPAAALYPEALRFLLCPYLPESAANELIAEPA